MQCPCSPKVEEMRPARDEKDIQGSSQIIEGKLAKAKVNEMPTRRCFPPNDAVAAAAAAAACLLLVKLDASIQKGEVVVVAYRKL